MMGASGSCESEVPGAEALSRRLGPITLSVVLATLQRFEKLRDTRVITPEEFEMRRAALLQRIEGREHLGP